MLGGKELLLNEESISDRYILQYELGKGGMSTVYLARDIKLNMDWAIKVIDLSNKQEHVSVYKTATEKEITMLKELKHPALPRIVDFFSKDEKMYIVMDYIEGETLSDKLEREGKQREENVVKWMRGVCDVLNYLHTRKTAIIYRDIKPSNIMLTPEGNVKLIDFGIARTYKSDSQSDTQYLGSRGYAAPEQCSRLGQTDARTDIYGIGATMYHLLTGQHPDQPPYEFYPIRKWDKSFSRSLQQIVQRCVMTDPQYRYQSVMDIIEQLENYQKEERNNFRKLIFTGGMLFGSIVSIGITIVQLFSGNANIWYYVTVAMFLAGFLLSCIFMNVKHLFSWFLGKEEKIVEEKRKNAHMSKKVSSTYQIEQMKESVNYGQYQAGAETMSMGDKRVNRQGKYFQFYVTTNIDVFGMNESLKSGGNDGQCR